MPTPTRIRLVITCAAAPPATHNGQPTEFGLQDKQEILHPGTLLPDGALRCACEVAVKSHATGIPDYGGPFVHGSTGARFLYLGWRLRGGAWIKRFKISLAPISWGQIEAAQDGALAVRMDTARSGTVALLGAGWASSDDQQEAEGGRQ